MDEVLVRYCSSPQWTELSSNDLKIIETSNLECVDKESLSNSFNFLTDMFNYVSGILLKDPTYMKQLKLWLFQSIGSINIDSETNTRCHHRLFGKFMNSTDTYSKSIVKEVLQLYSDKAVRLLKRRLYYFQDFFRNSKSRCEGWFQHFHYNGKMLYGARAIERFTFNRRKELVYY